MGWVLILFIVSSSGGAGAAMQDFGDRGSCEWALHSVKSSPPKSLRLYFVDGVCVEKGGDDVSGADNK